MKLLLVWLVNALCLLAVAWLLPGIYLGGLGSALVAAAVLGAVNLVIRPALQLLALPVTFLTLGLFALVVNAAAFGLAAWLSGRGFAVSGFWAALFGALLYGLLSAGVSALLLKRGDDD